jgi:hypothetical protein
MTRAAHARFGMVDVLDETEGLALITLPTSCDEQFWVRKSEFDELFEPSRITCGWESLSR